MMIRRRWARLGSLVAMAVLLAGVLAILRPSLVAAQPLGDDACLAFATDVVVAEGEVRGCSQVIVNGDLTVEQGGVIDGSVSVVGGTVDVAGTVRGDVWSSEDVTLRETAVVEGEVGALGEIDQRPGADVRGDVGFAMPRADEGVMGDPPTLVDRIVPGLLMVVFAIAFAALLTAVAPLPVRRVREAALRRKVVTFGVGLLALLLLVPLFLILVMTVVGALLLPLLYLAGIALGWVALGQALGRRVVDGSDVVAAALGTGVLSLLMSVGLVNATVFCVTFVLWVLLSAWAFGAALMTVWGTRDWPASGYGPEDVPPLPGAPPLGEPPEHPRDTEPAPLPPAIGEATGRPAVRFDEPLPEAGADREPPPEAAAEPSAPAEPPEIPPPPDHAPEVEPFTAPADERASDAEPDEAPHEDAPDEVAPSVEPDQRLGGPEGASAETPHAAGPAATAGAAAQGPGAAKPSEGDAPSASDAAALGVDALSGITPVYAHLLREAGITTLGELAAAEPEHVAEVLSVPGVIPVQSTTAARWVERARERTGR